MLATRSADIPRSPAGSAPAAVPRPAAGGRERL